MKKHLGIFVCMLYLFPQTVSAQDSLKGILVDRKDPLFFEEVYSSKFKTPYRFESSAYLDNLAKNSAVYFTHLDTLISSKYLSNESLIPSTMYEIIYYKIPPGASVEECLSFLEEKEAILCGAGCLSLLVQYMPSKILEGWTMSLDKRERLFDYGRHEIDAVHIKDTWYPTEGCLGVPWILYFELTGQKEFILFPGRVPDGISIEINQYMIAFIPYK